MIDANEIAIVGPGKVGAALAVLAQRAGWKVAAVGARQIDEARRTLDGLGVRSPVLSPAEAAGTAETVLLTVPDDAIADVCAELAGAKAFRAGAVVAHTSGALDSGALSPARDRCGCATGSMHPMQTFPSVRAAVDTFGGTWCFCEGDEPAVERLERFARDIGAKTARIEPGCKALYHAAGVVASNYLAAIQDAALAMAQRAGIEPQAAREALAPLVRATVDNVFASSPREALTGPIVRGDAGTVRRHVEQLRRLDKRLLRVYQAMGLWTVDIARRRGTDPAALAEIEEILKDGDG